MDEEVLSDPAETKGNSGQDDSNHITEGSCSMIMTESVQPALRRMIYLGYELEPYRARSDDGRGITSVDRLGFNFLKAWNLEMFSEKMRQDFLNQIEKSNQSVTDGDKQCEESPKFGWPSPIVVEMVQKVLTSNGSACRPAAIFVLAACCRCEGLVRPAAYSCMRQLNRPEDLFLFIKYAMDLTPKRRGWGAGLRRAVKTWYTDRFGVMEIAEFVTQIKQRHSWSHKDVLKQAHVKGKNKAQEVVLQYTLFGLDKAQTVFTSIPENDETIEEAKQVIAYLEAAEKLRKLRIPKGSDDECLEVKEAVKLIKAHKFTIEHCDDCMYTSPKIWEAVIGHMSLRQLLIFLPALRFNRMFKSGCELTKVVLHALRKAGDVITESTVNNIFPCVSPALVLISMQTFRRRNSEIMPTKLWFRSQDAEKPNEVSASQESGANKSTATGDGAKPVGPSSAKKKCVKLPTDLPKANSKVLEVLSRTMVISMKALKPTGKRFIFGAGNLKEKIRCAGSPFVMTFEAAATTLMCIELAEAEGNTTAFSVNSDETSCRKLRINGCSLSNCAREILQGISTNPVKVDWWLNWLCQEKCCADVLVLVADEVFCDKGSGEKLFSEFSKYRSNLNLPKARLVIISLTSEMFPSCDDLTNQDVLMVYGLDSNLPFIIQNFARGDF